MKKTLATILLFSCLISTGLADEASRVKAAKQIVNDYGDAIVWVSAVSKTEMSGMGALLGGQGEQEVEAVGTVIAPSGLTVVSYTTLDPMSMIGSITANIGGDATKIEAKSNISDVKITLADGTEVDAKLVLKDPDLDLAFIMPQKSEGVELPTFKYIPLEQNVKAEVLDSLIELSRLGKSLNRQCSVQLSRVSAVVTKPRTFYCGGAGMGGTPAFTEKGKALGISIIRIPKGGGMMAMRSIQPVILPAEDVLEIAEQALQSAKKDDEKTEDTDEETKEDANEKGD